MKGRGRIFVTGPLPVATKAALEQHAAVAIAPDTDPATLRAGAAQAEVIVVRHRLPEDIFDAAPSLLGAVRHGAGLDYIPVAAATPKGILVCNVPGANADAVAEYCVMQILNLLRRPAAAESSMREAGWAKARFAVKPGRELRGLTAGILGFGAIGSRVGRILHHGFQAHVVAWDRRREALPEWASAASVDEIVARADIIVPCVPLAPETRHLVSASRIAAMKPSAVVVNASRGAVLDEDALLDALRKGRIAGAALDVFAEPPAPGGAIMSVPNLLLTPHMAGNTGEAQRRIGLECAAESLRILRGERPANLVNPEAWPLFSERRRAL